MLMEPNLAMPCLGLTEVDHYRSGAEPVGFVADVKDSDCEPDAADSFCQIVQVPPDQPTKREADQRQHLRLRKHKQLQ